MENENAQCRTWEMARKLKNIENEKRTLLNWNMGRNTEKVENEKQPLDDLKNDEITKIREK